MSITTKIDEAGNQLTVFVDGKFDFSIYDEFRKAYQKGENGNFNFSVDLNKTVYMDSSALGMLLLLKEYAGESNKVNILNPSEEVKTVLNIANFDKIFNIS
ncbi:MAG TPA: anti-anti-sigma factor [Gammaproteobacteria bacterium]|nr:anti-anti-sigma factor [Gammaproteobacteria bacterium]